MDDHLPSGGRVSLVRQTSPSCLFSKNACTSQFQTRMRERERILRRGQSRGRIHDLETTKFYFYGNFSTKTVIICFSLLHTIPIAMDQEPTTPFSRMKWICLQ